MKTFRRLDEVCNIIMGQAPSGDAYNTDGVGWPLIAGAGDFGDTFPAAKKYTTAASKLSQQDDIVLGIRASIGDKVLSDGVYCLGRGVAGLRPREELDKRYLWHWLTFARWMLVSKAKGATFKQVNREDIGSLVISLPPLPEQRRIAAILDQADALISERKRAIDTLANLEVSIYHDVIGDLVGNHRNWPDADLGGVVEFRTGKLDSNAAVDYGEFPFFTCAREDLRIDRYDFDCEALLLAGNNASADYSVKYYKGKFNAYQRTYVITLRDKANSYEYVRMALEQSLKELKRISKGTNTKYLTLGLLNKVRILAPPPEIQLEYESKIDKVRQCRNGLTLSLEQLRGLFATLQFKAFRGEL